MNNIEKTSVDICTGCMCCKSICTEKAIRVYRNEEGFDYPLVDSDKCINCGKCVGICPANSDINKSFAYEYAYALQADERIRMNSSSGGCFSLLAMFFLESGGIVCGAAFVNNRVKHIIVHNIEDLDKLRKSKYVQSDIVDCYDEIHEYLRIGKRVLFTGTACQCEAIKNYCSDYENLLYTCDVLCMGVPAPGIFEKYIDEELGRDVEDIDFRDKCVEGWSSNLFFSYKKNGKKIVLSSKNSSFFSCFLGGYALRKSCYNCKYAGKKRISDLTMGDFWGIGEYDRELDDGKGTSLLLISTPKGERLINSIIDRCRLIKRIPIDIAKEANPILLFSSADRGLRKVFFKLIRQNSLKETVNAVNGNKSTCGIINFWWADDNGGILTAYALQQTLFKLGYSSKLIDFKNDYRSGGISEKFGRKHLDVTLPVLNDEDYYKLNDSFDNFLVGSDQVFRAEWVPDHWFLDFVNDEKNKVAISASFGKDFIDASVERRLRIKYLLSRFNSISIREKQGVKLCTELGTKAINIIDPVFYLSRKDYEEKLDIRKECVTNKYIFVYYRDMSDEKNRLYKQVANHYNCQMFCADDDTEVETFLEKMLNSEMVITDSYHGVCFSLIFNKKYLCILNELRGLERFQSLIETFHLSSSKFLDEKELKLDLRILEEDDDWESINNIIREKANEGIEWIDEAIRNKQKSNIIAKYKNLCALKIYLCVKHVLEIANNRLEYLKMRVFKKACDDRIVLFGAGVYGTKAISIYGKKIYFFIDNSKKKQWLEGYPVFSLNEASKLMRKNTKIIITTSRTYQNEIRRQLLDSGFSNVSVFDEGRNQV